MGCMNGIPGPAPPENRKRFLGGAGPISRRLPLIQRLGRASVAGPLSVQTALVPGVGGRGEDSRRSPFAVEDL